MLLNTCICNFCGKECKHEEYNIPMFMVETTYVTNSKGVKLFPFRDKKLENKNVDLCDDCKIKVARLMELVEREDNEPEEEYHQITMDEYLESLGDGDD